MRRRSGAVPVVLALLLGACGDAPQEQAAARAILVPITHAQWQERLPLNAGSEQIMGVEIRKVAIPVAAGRNLAVLTEATS